MCEEAGSPELNEVPMSPISPVQGAEDCNIPGLQVEGEDHMECEPEQSADPEPMNTYEDVCEVCQCSYDDNDEGRLIPSNLMHFTF